MYIRRLVKSGNSSLVVAVPQDWIKRNALKQGDEVYIEEVEGALRLGGKPKKVIAEQKEKNLSVDCKDMQVVKREIINAYLNNYQHIIIRGTSLPSVQQEVKQTITSLIALEVVEEDAHRIEAKSFLDIHDIDLKPLMRRMDNIVRSMLIDAKGALHNPQLAQGITDRDLEVNRLYFLIIRILKIAFQHRELLESLHISDLDILRYWDLNKQLEKIGDRVKYIASDSGQLKEAEHKEYVRLLESIDSMYKDVMKAFYSQSEKEAIDASIRRHQLLKQIQEYIRKNKNPAVAQIAVNAYSIAANLNDITRIVTWLSEPA